MATNKRRKLKESKYGIYFTTLLFLILETDTKYYTANTTEDVDSSDDEQLIATSHNIDDSDISFDDLFTIGKQKKVKLGQIETSPRKFIIPQTKQKTICVRETVQPELGIDIDSESDHENRGFSGATPNETANMSEDIEDEIISSPLYVERSNNEHNVEIIEELSEDSQDQPIQSQHHVYSNIFKNYSSLSSIKKKINGISNNGSNINSIIYRDQYSITGIDTQSVPEDFKIIGMKRNLIRGGFADKIQKLFQKQKYDKLVNKNNSSNDNKSDYIDMFVTILKYENNNLRIQGYIIDQQNNKERIILNSNNIIVFTSIDKSINLKSGDVIRIFPPWNFIVKIDVSILICSSITVTNHFSPTFYYRLINSSLYHNYNISIDTCDHYNNLFNNKKTDLQFHKNDSNKTNFNILHLGTGTVKGVIIWINENMNTTVSNSVTSYNDINSLLHSKIQKLKHKSKINVRQSNELIAIFQDEFNNKYELQSTDNDCTLSSNLVIGSWFMFHNIDVKSISLLSNDFQENNFRIRVVTTSDSFVSVPCK